MRFGDAGFEAADAETEFDDRTDGGGSADAGADGFVFPGGGDFDIASEAVVGGFPL